MRAARVPTPSVPIPHPCTAPLLVPPSSSLSLYPSLRYHPQGSKPPRRALPLRQWLSHQEVYFGTPSRPTSARTSASSCVSEVHKNEPRAEQQRAGYRPVSTARSAAPAVHFLLVCTRYYLPVIPIFEALSSESQM
jgi:hypothetical protein